MNQQIPDQIKQFANSAELYDVVEKIGAKFSLHIDQMGELYAEISDILLGFSKSSDFTKHIAERLEISRGDAERIVEEVNKDVFQTLKVNLQKQTEDSQPQPEPQQSLADLERVGGFTIEPTGQNGNGSGAVPANLPGAEAVTESKEDLLSGIEDPATIPPKSTVPEENHTDILVDHLLANPMGAAEEKIEKKAPTADSYREPIN